MCVIIIDVDRRWLHIGVVMGFLVSHVPHFLRERYKISLRKGAWTFMKKFLLKLAISLIIRVIIQAILFAFNVK